MNAQEVQISIDQGIVRVILSRARKRNALTQDMMTMLRDTFRSLSTDKSVRLIVLSAEGQDFCAGADLGQMANKREVDRESDEKLGPLLETVVHPLIQAIDSLPQPVLAVARGNAIGIGAQFLLLADLMVVSQSLSLRFPQATLGHNLDHGESWLLPRSMPLKRAMELALTGSRMTAEDAFNSGIVNRVVPDDLLETEAEAMINDLMAVAPGSLARNKELLKAASSSSLAQSLALERRHFSESIQMQDFREAMMAFKERRAPVFTGE